MEQPQIRFEDGAAYEDFMGVWSRSAGEDFLRWLAPPAHRRWADVGCGNGAFTELLVERCAPQEVQGIDPRKRSSRSRAPVSPLPGCSCARATRWRCRGPTTRSTPP